MTETPSSLRFHPWKPNYGPADRPLTSFYIPALQRSLRYDRIAGFFSSAALSVAAQGVASMIARGGRMRLIVGAQLHSSDVEALLRGIELQDVLTRKLRGALTDPKALADHLTRRRLETLAWLAANDRLQIRVAVEADPQTNVPIASDGYFHAKAGILQDETGDGVVFSGSVNETATAWRNNYESFSVFTSWEDAKHFAPQVEMFERLWADAESGWRTVDLPSAMRDELVTLAPAEPPGRDPELDGAIDETDTANWLTQFVRDAPFLVGNGRYVGVETAAVKPFPHQRAVAYDILDRFPCNHLLADEVGLGKTIEAGLILRSLLISGRAERCLIVVPRSLAKQWQEELRDRFLVQAPFYDGARYVWFNSDGVQNEPISPDDSPWEQYPVVIASSQMVKREDRARELLAAPEWDLVLVDEAHHARQREFNPRRDRPNRLLSLLRRLAKRTKSMLFLTATPMQVDPVEVRDLLAVLGLPDGWESGGNFVDYFRAKGKSYAEMPWDVVHPLLKSSMERWGMGALDQTMRSELGPVDRSRVVNAVNLLSSHRIASLDSNLQVWVRRIMEECNPVNHTVHRHTRDLLRDYSRRGLVNHHIANRNPKPIWLEMSSAERHLYGEVEDYISEYYKRYEEERAGLGFVMTIYRRRLTSGLFALRESLKRRRANLMNATDAEPETKPALFEDEDIEDDDLESDVAEILEDLPEFVSEEVEKINELVHLLDEMPSETKLGRVLSEIDQELKTTAQVIVFTQYTDTMDYLREHLKPTYGSHLGCYSGRGGERWNAETESWNTMSKEQLQREFADGAVKVLICTDAAAEGLNLQNCGSMFNYDMPWNPMKVEQRIGRIDRIGQVRTTVKIRHFMYRGTVESDVYAALGDRINWFENIVGELQPILEVARNTIRQASMQTGDEREHSLRQGLDRITSELLRARENPSPLRDLSPVDDPPVPKSSVALSDLQALVEDKRAWGGLLKKTTDSSYFQLPSGDRALSFDIDKAESPDVTFFSYGAPEFCSLIESIPVLRPRQNIVRLESDSGSKSVGYYGWTEDGWSRIESLVQLRSALDSPPPTRPPSAAPAQAMFDSDRVTAG